MMSLISLWKSTILALAEVDFIEILTVNASLQATVTCRENIVHFYGPESTGEVARDGWK